jgi:hypothetical protein
MKLDIVLYGPAGIVKVNGHASISYIVGGDVESEQTISQLLRLPRSLNIMACYDVVDCEAGDEKCK